MIIGTIDFKCKFCGGIVPQANGIYGRLRSCKCGKLRVDWDRSGYHRVLGSTENYEKVSSEEKADQK
jgi:hypothetical protein